MRFSIENLLEPFSSQRNSREEKDIGAVPRR